MSLMTTDQLSLYLNIPAQTLKNWRSAGSGPPYIKVNGWLVRYDPRVVDRWLTEHTVTP